MKKKMILIDDQQSMRSFLSNYFKSDYEVHPFENGKEAVRFMAEGNEADVALLDIMMPEMNGFQTLSHIRNAEKGSPKVVMLSSVDTSEDKIKCFDLGADDYVVKPFNPVELNLRVKRLVQTE